MKRRIALWTLNVVATLGGGGVLTYLVVTAPFNMPYPVDAGIRLCLNSLGHNELANPDDMAVLAFFVYLFFSILVSGAVVLIANGIVFSRYAKKRKGESANNGSGHLPPRTESHRLP